MKIDRIHLPSFRNDEHFRFQTEFLDLVNTTTDLYMKIRPQVDRYVELYRQEDAALKKIVKSPLTEEIHDADHRRDLVFRDLVAANRLMLGHFTPATAEAARRLKIPFDTYGDLTLKALEEETSAIYNLTKDLLSDRYREDVKTVGLNTWISELERLNNLVARLMEQRYTETADRNPLVLRAVRLQVDDAYHAIADRIDALNLLRPDDDETDYDGFVRNLNAIIDRANRLLVARRHRGGKKKEEEAGEEEI